MDMKHSKKIPVIIVLLAVLITGVVFLLIKGRKEEEAPVQAKAENKSYRIKEADGERYRYNSDLLSLLFLGIDSSDEEIHGQSDAIDLVIFDREKSRIRILSISRDSMVPIQVFNARNENLGWEMQHLALASSYGSSGERGCMLAAEAVSRMLGEVPVVYYGAADISSIARFQELIGEMRITLPEGFQGLPKDIPVEGNEAVITPQNVESFVRIRDVQERFSNETRMERQKLYMEAYMNHLRGMLDSDFEGTVRKMKNLFPLMLSNIGIDEVSAFAEMLLEYQYNSSEDFYTVEGSDREGRFHDEFQVDEKALERTVLNLFYEKEEQKQ